MPRIVLTNRIPASPRQCFELSLSVDAHTASMGTSRERAVGGVTSGVLRLGDTVSWRAKHFGLSFTMTSRISEFDAPNRFVDEQVAGPFRSWWHEHRFEPVSGGGTLMTDTVQFESPAGVLGRVVDQFVLTGYLTRLLSERNRWLVEALSAPDAWAMPELEVSPRLTQWIERNFEPAAAGAVLAALRELPPHAVGSQRLERIQAALVIRTEGEWRRFQQMLELVNMDWRDVLVAAGLADADWPLRLDAVLGS